MDAGEDPTTAKNTAFRRANKRQDELVRGGVSQSGHERNCCFLNTQGERFANVSAVAGLDHIGDGRAYAAVDWDNDGDLDLWLTNRNSPRVMFLRNNAEHQRQKNIRHFLALRLKGNGTTTNRDAVGARVTVELTGDTRPIVKTLRAGEGFLSQSSKAMHFGLGENDQIAVVTIRWPGGEVQQLTNLAADRAYLILQGSDQPEPWRRPTEAVALTPSPNEPLPRTDLARIPLRFPIPLPALSHDTFGGGPVSLDSYQNSPTLVNFWASWCTPCLAELKEFSDRSDELRKAGLKILALSVDGVATDTAADPKKAESLLKQLRYEFQSGMADAELIEKVELVFDYLFDHKRRWAVPTSLLLDSEGRLSAIYIGRLEVDQLLSDVTSIKQDRSAWLAASLPFPGRWTDKPRTPDMWPFVTRLFEEKRTQDGIEFFSRLEKLQAPSVNTPEALMALALALRDEGQLSDAANRFSQLIQTEPDNALAHSHLSAILYKLGKEDEAKKHSEAAVLLDANMANAHFILANVLQKEGFRSEATSHYEAVVELEPDLFEGRITLGSIYAEDERWPEAIAQLTKAVELRPDAVDAHFQLARCLQVFGKFQEADTAYEQALQLAPKNSRILYSSSTNLVELGQPGKAIERLTIAYQADRESLLVLNGLAWLLATQPDVSDTQRSLAVELAEKAGKRTGMSNPQILDTLAATYASAGKYEEAVATAHQAIERAKQSGSKELVEQLQSRLALYQQRQPYYKSDGDH